MSARSRQEITAIVHRYCELFDTGRFDEFAAQFADGQWHRAEPGADAARQWIDDWVYVYDGVPGTKHVTTNLIVTVDEPSESATASAYITVFQSLPDLPFQPIFAGRYRDRFARVGGDWRWLRRATIGDLYGDTSRHVRRTPRSSDA